MDWFSALKEYKMKTGFKGIAPKKGSAEYMEVKRIMERGRVSRTESFKPKPLSGVQKNTMEADEEPTETKVIRKYKKKVVVEEPPQGEPEQYEVEKPVKKIIKKKLVKKSPVSIEVQTEEVLEKPRMKKSSVSREVQTEKPPVSFTSEGSSVVPKGKSRMKKSMIVVPMYNESSDDEHKVFIPPTVMKGTSIPGRKDKLEEAKLSTKKQPVDDVVNIVIANAKKLIKEGMVPVSHSLSRLETHTGSSSLDPKGKSGFAMKKEKHCK